MDTSGLVFHGPCGIYISKTEFQLYICPPEMAHISYFDSPDLTLSGSQNAHSALVFWSYIYKHLLLRRTSKKSSEGTKNSNLCRTEAKHTGGWHQAKFVGNAFTIFTCCLLQTTKRRDLEEILPIWSLAEHCWRVVPIRPHLYHGWCDKIQD